jgi:hypothetical protein
VKYSAGILEQSIGARNRVGIRLSYRARICKRLWSPVIDFANLCSLSGRGQIGLLNRHASLRIDSWAPEKVYKYELRLRIHTLAESIPGRIKSKLSPFLSLPLCRRSSLLTGGGRGRESKSYEREKSFNALM